MTLGSTSSSCGPFRRGTAARFASCSRIRTARRQPLRALSAKVLASIKKIDHRTYHAPSPWHAAAWLLDVTALMAQMAVKDADTGPVVPLHPQFGAPVFRGQRNPDWGLGASIWRPPRRPLDFLELELFIDAVSRLFAYEENRMNTRAHGRRAALRDADAAAGLHRRSACGGVLRLRRRDAAPR